MASRSSGIPAFGVYPNRPSRSAWCAASTIGAGVGKSGSPAESAMTSRPSRRRAFARAEMASVADGRMAATCGLRASSAGGAVIGRGGAVAEGRRGGGARPPRPP